jgi:hypothetical protein
MVKQVKQEFTDKQITYLFLAKYYGLEKVSDGWKAIGKNVQTTGAVIGLLWGCGLLKGSKDATPVTEYHEANRISINESGVKLLDEVCDETGICFQDGATDWNYVKGLWRVDYNYRYKKYSFYKWEEVEEEKTLLERAFDR